jgi:serine/threonine protein kinase
LLDTYQARQLLGRGRSGEAYLAEHLPSGQLAVAKLFAPDPEREPLWERARREVRRIMGLRHPHVVPMYSCSTVDLPRGTKAALRASRYLLTLCPYAPSSLARVLAEQAEAPAPGVLSSEQINARIRTLSTYLAQLRSALVTAHAQGVVHGALVPGNLLLENARHLWVADFGLARLHPPAAPYLAPELRGASPVEQWEAANPASEQYMLAVLCHHLWLHLLPQPIFQPWTDLLKRALDPSPARRFATIEQFLQALLERMVNGEQGSGNAPQPKEPTSLPRPYLQPPPMLEPVHPRDTGVREPAPRSPPRESPAPADGLVRRAEQAFLRGEFLEAAKAYREALSVHGREAGLWVALGDAYVAEAQYDLALQAYEQAIALDPNDPLGWSNKAVALEGLGRPWEAADCHERARRLKAERGW